MVKLKFYDVKAKKSFTTDKFKTVVKGKRKFVVAKSPITGIQVFRIVSNK